MLAVVLVLGRFPVVISASPQSAPQTAASGPASLTSGTADRLTLKASGREFLSDAGRRI